MSDYSAAPPPNALAFALRAAPKVTATIIMLALAAVWLGPIILIVMTSIKSNEAFLAGPFALPTSPTLAPYFSVWASMQFGTLLANSLLYATVGIGAGGVCWRLCPRSASAAWRFRARRSSSACC